MTKKWLIRGAGHNLSVCDDMMQTWKLAGIAGDEELKEYLIKKEPTSVDDIR